MIKTIRESYDEIAKPFNEFLLHKFMHKVAVDRAQINVLGILYAITSFKVGFEDIRQIKAATDVILYSICKAYPNTDEQLFESILWLRQPLQLDYFNEKYTVSFRCAVTHHPMFNTLQDLEDIKKGMYND